VFDFNFFYPLRDTLQNPLWGVPQQNQSEVDTGESETHQVESFISLFYGNEGSICRGGIPLSTLGMGQPGGLVRSFSEGTAFPTVFTLDHPSSKTLIEILDQLIAQGVIAINGKTVSEVGSGAGWIAVQMALRDAASVHAYDLNLLKAANSAATARLYGVADRVYAYCSRSATVLPASALYLWNVPDFHEKLPEQAESAVMDQHESILANSRMPVSDAQKVFSELATVAPSDGLVLIRINSKNGELLFKLLEGSPWKVHPASRTMPSSAHEGGAFYLLQRA
jgi:hypothetical protein